MADHTRHTWSGFRGGNESFQMCVVCGKRKDVEETEPDPPAPEPVEVKAEDLPPAPPTPEPVEVEEEEPEPEPPAPEPVEVKEEG